MSDKEFLILKVIIKLKRCFFSDIKKYFAGNSDSTIKTYLGRLSEKEYISYDIVKGKNLYYSNVDKNYLLKYQIDNLVEKNCNLDYFILLDEFLNKVELSYGQKEVLIEKIQSIKTQDIKCTCDVCVCLDCKD